MTTYNAQPLTPEARDHILTNAANYDMRIARNSGSVLIIQTARGNLELTYDRSAKRYTLSTVGAAFPVYREPETIAANVTAAQARDELKKVYIIVEE